MQHHLGCAAGEEDLHGRVVPRAVGESVDEARNLAIDVCPVFCGGPLEFCGVGDGGDVQEEVGRSAEGRVDDHGVVDCGLGEDVVSSKMQLLEAQNGAGRAAGGVEPDGLAGRSKSGMRKGEAKSFGDDLRRCSGAEKLTASAGRGAGAAADLGSILERDLMLREACADGLDLAGVFSVFRQQCDAPGDENAWQRAGGGQRHHHRGEAFVAGGDAEDAGARGKRAHQSAQDDGGVVAVGQRVEHAGGALGAAVARVGAGSGEGDGVERFQFARGFGYQSADLPVAGVKAESDGSAVWSAEAAVGAEDEDFGAEDARGVPAHADVLAEPEEIAGGLGEEHLRGDGENTRGAGGVGSDGAEGEVGAFENGCEGYVLNDGCSCLS